jgi:hypothetical protein
MNRMFFCLAVAIPLAVSSLYAQSMPLTAKVRSTNEVIVNGKVVDTHVREGLFYRASDGSELRRPVSLDGKPVQGEGARASLFDKPHATNYAIDYEKGEAFHAGPPPSFSPARLPTLESAVPPPSGQSSVEGYPCTLRPVYLVRPQGRILIGSNCVSEEYGLVLRTDVTTPSAITVGKAAHQTTELYDIHIGVEPDPKLFDLSSFKKQ